MERSPSSTRGRASVLLLLAAGLSLAFALAIRQRADAIDQPTDTMAVWG